MTPQQYNLKIRTLKQLVSLITDVHITTMNDKLDIKKTVDRCDNLARDIINDVKHTIENDK